MKTRVIPAQITTVEDKIAGNLNLTQILLLMVTPFWTTIVYSLFIPKLELAWYKLPIIGIVSLLSIVLAVRVKGKVLLNWLVLILHYNVRPRFYLFNKNEAYLRALDLPATEKKQKAEAKREAEKTKAVPIFTTRELAKLENIIADPKYSLSLKSAKKGGLDVAFEQNPK